MKKTLFLALILLLTGNFTLSAQMSFLSASKARRPDRTGKPTIINADAMDIDIQNNKAVFMGNVMVDDPEITITCRKMTIILEDSDKDEKDTKKDAKAADAKQKDNKKDDKKDKDEDDPIGGKELSKIICTEEVVITRKLPLSNGDSQKALADRAVYDLKEGTIELSEKPVVIKGNSNLQGEKITLYTDSERITVVNAIATSSNLNPSMKKK